MKRHLTLPVLTVTALICRALCWYPVWMLICALFNPAQPHLPLITAVLTGSGAVSGFLICRIRNKRGGSHPLCILCAAVLCAAAGYAVSLLNGRFFPAAALPFTVFFSAVNASDKTPDLLFSPTRFGAMMIGVILTIGLLLTASFYIPLTETAAVCGIAAIGFLFLRNQSMLQHMVSRRAGNGSAVPQDIRRSNLRMVCVLIIGLTVVFFLREPILWGLGKLGDGCLIVLKTGFSGLRALFSLFSGDAPPAEEIEAAADSGLQTQEENSLTWLINLIIIIPTLIIAFYIWKQFVSEWLSDFRDAVISMIQRLRAKRSYSRSRGNAEGEYTDTESDVTPEPRRKRRMREWAKQFRAWKQMPDQPEKFYAGYRLFLTAPVWNNAPADADTARELCAKWRILLPADTSLDAPTAALEQDRYAMDGLPGSAYADMTAALTTISKIR